jgi:hypothetical protein
MREAGYLSGEREGKSIRYSVVFDEVKRVSDLVNNFIENS